MLINNESGRTTRPASDGVYIIDLALSTAELGFLTLWEIAKDYPSLSDHELISLRWEDTSYDLPSKEAAVPTGWDTYGLTKSSDNLESARIDWIGQSKSQKLLDQTSNQKDLDKEVGWVEKNLAKVLIAHAKVLKVTFFSKRW